jgi:hypothetical protein
VHNVGSTGRDVAAEAEAAELFSRSIRQTRNATYGGSALACQAKALQHSLPNEALSISRAGFGREFDERIALPNGRDAPIDLGSAANAF